MVLFQKPPLKRMPSQPVHRALATLAQGLELLFVLAAVGIAFL